jgi:pSer/pThr/pTyr-binding forkhead associated (FHA) protein
MSGITLRVLDGADRGRIFSELMPPVTIGREEGNTIQLNDERVSRYHIKIQEDHEKLVLTDLESTNGTKVNGEDIQLRILRFGDMITIGRSVLLFGSRDQIAARLAELRRKDVAVRGTIESSHSKEVRGSSFDFELNLGEDEMQGALHTMEPPELPERLTAGQAAQLSEVLEFIHIRLRNLLNTVNVEGKGEKVSLDARQWQFLIDLQARIADYLRDVTNPNRDL